MSPLGSAHTATAVAAMLIGGLVLLTAKGTARHRWLGWAYVTSMVLLNVSALFIYRLFGRFGPFHAGAVFSLLTVVLGAFAAVQVRRYRAEHRAADRARALDRHYMWMTWSYVGLLAAAVSEVATRVPILRPRAGHGVLFGVTVAVVSLVVFVLGARVIRGRKSALLARHGIATAFAADRT